MQNQPPGLGEILPMRRPAVTEDNAMDWVVKLVKVSYDIAQVRVAEQSCLDHFEITLPANARLLRISRDDDSEEQAVVFIDAGNVDYMRFELMKTWYNGKNRLACAPGWMFTLPDVRWLYYFFVENGELYTLDLQDTLHWVENQANHFTIERRKVQQGKQVYYSLLLSAPCYQIRGSDLRKNLNVYRVIPAGMVPEDFDYIQIL